MSNSPLVDVTIISPHKTSPRTHKIDTVTVHCVVGQASADSLGTWFQRSGLNASSNYGIGFDGQIGMYVEEKDASWCSSNSANDNRAITIEVASDNFHPYAVNPAVYEALIKLLADICKRNNIKKLLWKADKSLIGQIDKQNMTVHRWFANKACPGDYLYERHGDIANRVNALLGSPEATTPTEKPKEGVTVFYRVKVNGKQVGAFEREESAFAFANLKGGEVYSVSYGVEAPINKTPANAQPANPSINLIEVALGGEGQHVTALQTLLAWRGYNLGRADGIFGKNTLAAVKKFQLDKGITADGICGTETWLNLLKA